MNQTRQSTSENPFNVLPFPGPRDTGKHTIRAMAANLQISGLKDEVKLTEGLTIAGDSYIEVGHEPSAREEFEMADLTREEHDAKLVAVEAKIDTKLVTMAASLKAISDTINRVDKKLDAVSSAVSSSKWHLLFAAFAVVGLIAAFLAFGAQVFDTALNFVDTVRNAPTNP